MLFQGIPTEEVTPRSFKLFYINDTHKTVGARAQVLLYVIIMSGYILGVKCSQSY